MSGPSLVITHLSSAGMQGSCFRSKRVSERSSRRIRFHPQVEELHYHQEPEESDKRKVKADKMSVGLFNPIKFLNSIDQWRIEKFETEI